MKEILENIRKIRLEKRFKTKELAEKLGMTPPNYASIEAGRVPLTVDRLKEIAIILGVNHLDLLNGTASSGNEANGASSEELERLKLRIKELENDKENYNQFIIRLLKDENEFKEVIAKISEKLNLLILMFAVIEEHYKDNMTFLNNEFKEAAKRFYSLIIKDLSGRIKDKDVLDYLIKGYERESKIDSSTTLLGFLLNYRTLLENTYNKDKNSN